jgi:hypothetical protein
MVQGLMEGAILSPLKVFVRAAGPAVTCWLNGHLMLRASCNLASGCTYWTKAHEKSSSNTLQEVTGQQKLTKQQ